MYFYSRDSAWFLLGVVVLALLALLIGYCNEKTGINDQAQADVDEISEAAEIQKKLSAGTLLVWKADSSVTRVRTINSDYSEIRHEGPNGSGKSHSAEFIAEQTLFVFPPRSSLQDDYGNITRYRRAALVFADPGYDNYFAAPVH